MNDEYPYIGCDKCEAYRKRRHEDGVITSTTYRHYAAKRSVSPVDVMDEFLRGVHARHTAGLSLDPA